MLFQWPGGTIGIKWTKARDVATVPTIHKTCRTPQVTTKNYLAQNVSGINIKKPGWSFIWKALISYWRVLDPAITRFFIYKHHFVSRVRAGSEKWGSLLRKEDLYPTYYINIGQNYGYSKEGKRRKVTMKDAMCV